MLSASESDSLDAENADNDSDFSLSSFSNESNLQKKSNRIPSPDPLWLQPIELPTLSLPNSSEDLLIPKQYALKVASIYEVFRRFKQLIRLTPFRLEDFCAALMSDEQSSLLTEIHIQLLRALLREEDSQGTQFGPQDHKDSINITLYLIDQLTWPEVLRSYLESHESFDKLSLNILNNKDYPFVAIEDRITVLQFLTDQFLITDIVRADLAREVPIIYDDHCRICHKLGDLVCCETCPAVFHLECVDPPLDNVPAGDYQCNLCKQQQIPGVYDCVSSLEKQGFLCRHEHLGYDRHGRKYWFINRRIFIEDEDTGEIWYYSTVPQFKEMLAKLDEDNMENALCAEISDFVEEIERQMAITETLTNKFKGHRKSYLELENQTIAKKEKHNHNDSDTENNKSKNDDENDTEDLEKAANDAKEKLKEKEIETKPEPPIANVVSTRLKTGSLTPRNYNTDDLKRKQTNEDAEARMTRLKNANLNCPFKLGHENTFKTYVNQFTSNVYALNKPQRNEDRDKKRPLSHKFSLTEASAFKWGGVLNGNRNSVIATLRQTLTSLEQAIPVPFMHPNWSTLRKLWLQAIPHCNRPSDFAKMLIIHTVCAKNCIFVNAWHEQLAHIKLERVTSIEREEKKKLEKREKRERDDEEERNRLAIDFVKYPLGQRHQVFKQKGEEYRIHGQWSWIWMSYGRRQRSNNGQTGEQIKPLQIVTQIKHNDSMKVVMLDPSTYDYLQSKCNNENSASVPAEISKTKIIPVDESFEQIDVSGALATDNRLLYPKIAKKSILDGLLKRRIQLKTEEELRIEKAQSNGENAEPPANVVTKPRGRKLTDIEKQLRRLCGIKGAPGASSAATALQSQNIDMDYVNEVAETIIKARDKFAQLNRLAKQYKCFSTCEANTNSYSLQQMKKDVCFSPLCLQKARVKEELLLSLKRSALHGDAVKETIMNIVNRKPSILEQKLTEGKAGTKQSNSSNETIVEMNPIKLQRNFLHALEKSLTIDYEKEVHKYIIISKDEKPQSPQTKMETDQEDAITASKDTNESIKMETDDDATTIKVEEDSEQTESHHDESSNDKNGIDVGDENSHERRSSRRSVKNRNSIKAAKANSKSADSDDSKAKSKDVANSIEVYVPPKLIIKPNRRFAGTSRIVKRRNTTKIEKEIATDGTERIYSTSTACGKVYLAKIPLHDHDPLKPIKLDATLAPLKYPAMHSFLTKKGFRSIMVLQNYELRKLARLGGKMGVNGFNPLSKSNTTVWPYPCSRPLFRTCWLYKTLNARTLATVALQLRILWSCLRWDDMMTKPPTSNGKIVTNTDTGIVSTDILRSRIRGRFSERTEYLRFTLVIPYGYADAQRKQG